MNTGTCISIVHNALDVEKHVHDTRAHREVTV
jgi:hypothetical protein